MLNTLAPEWVHFLYKEIQKEEIRNLRRYTIALAKAMQAAFCGDKNGSFSGFIDSLNVDKTEEDEIEKGIGKGIIEEN